MKLKVISAIVLSAISINAFAYKILSESHYCSPGAKCSSDVKINSDSEIFTELFKKKLAVGTNSFAYGATTNTLMPNVELQSSHWIGIKNQTTKNQPYYYRFTLSCENGMKADEFNIALSPNEEFHVSSTEYLTLETPVVGYHRITATTTVSGETSYDSQSSGILDVQKG